MTASVSCGHRDLGQFFRGSNDIHVVVLVPTNIDRHGLTSASGADLQTDSREQSEIIGQAGALSLVLL